MLEGKVEDKVIKCLTMYINFANPFKEIEVFQNFFGSFLAFAINFITKNKEC